MAISNHTHIVRLATKNDSERKKRIIKDEVEKRRVHVYSVFT